MQQKHKIKVYSTPTCVFCRATREFLDNHHIKYEDINVAENQKAAHEMVEKSGQMGVPVIDIDGTIIIGFDKNALSKALGIK